MREDNWAACGAAAGAVGVALYVVGSLAIGTPPDFDASGTEVAGYFDEHRTRIQVGSAIHAAWTPLFVWFLATVASLTRAGGGVLTAFAVLILRDKAIWPQWLGWLAAVAAAIYALRVGTLFTTDGAFAADGVLGLYVPVFAVAAWIVVASVLLTLRVRGASEPGGLAGAPHSGVR